jgi:N-acetylmuramoyl-L-alanine amidase
MRSQRQQSSQGIALFIILIALAAGGWALYEGSVEKREAQASRAAGFRVGLVAGHSGYDSGAVCPDGLTEVEVNQDVAERVADRLRRAGAVVDLMQEFDSRLGGYRADAFVAVHVDSCEADASGFKVARVQQSAIPEVEDRLVDCLWQRYGEATKLAPHVNSITGDMRDYHAFQSIHPQTPGAIIELGFLGGDRRLLTRRPDRVAEGVAEGIFCFLSGPQRGDP